MLARGGKVLTSIGVACLVMAAGWFVNIALSVLWDHRATRAANELASRRREPTIAASMAMPVLGGQPAEWVKLLPLDDGALALGERDDRSVVLVALDSNGQQRAFHELELDRCVRVDAVAIGERQVILLCATAHVGRLASIIVNGSEIQERPLGGEGVPLYCPDFCRLFSSTLGGEYVWLLPQQGGDRTMIRGRGLEILDIVAVRGLSTFVTGMLSFSARRELLVTHTDNATELRLSAIAPNGAMRTQVIARDEADLRGLMGAAVVTDGHEIGVVWRQLREPDWPRHSPTSVLVLSRFDEQLQPSGSRQQLSEDCFVAALRGYALPRGGLVAWDQGVHGTWRVGSFVRFDSIGELGHAVARRTSGGRLPTSVIQSGQKLFMLMPTESAKESSYETVILESP